MAAFEELYSSNFDTVYRYLHAMLGDGAAAEDATHQVFSRALDTFGDHPGEARPWLVSIARAAVRERGCSRDASHDGEASDPDLAAAVQRLPEFQRETVVLGYVLDMPPAEVAQALGRSRLLVRRAQRRALRSLERGLAREGGRATRRPLVAGVSPG
jgi:DNA-directed RNA polymerase specialized sigma24 family protein